MNGEEPPKHLSLTQAVIEWSDAKLVEAAQARQRAFTDQDLAQLNQPRLVARDLGQTVVAQTPANYGRDAEAARHAWSVLIQHFRNEIEDGALHLEGVEHTKDLRSEPQAIPGSYAASLAFNFARNTLTVVGKHFGAIRVSKNPSPWAPFEAPRTNGGTHRPPPQEVATLSDEVILQLLNEHIERVTKSREPKMLARIKDVLQPILMRRLQQRAAQGLLEPDLASEARELRKWISEVASWHYLPAEKTIVNNIRSTYRTLRARSNCPISE